MRIARILYPVTVLGPGKRIAIWVAGCGKRCKGCANPELWNGDDFPHMDMADLKKTLDGLYEKVEGQVDGITISGGEPFLQSVELLELVRYLKYEKMTKDILVFSGCFMEELLEDEQSAAVLQEIAVLVDGEYIEEQNQGEVLRGSANQRINILNQEFKEKYQKYMVENEGRHLVENFKVRDGVVSVGIHKKDFAEKLEDALRSRSIVRQ